jgi:hypothetical protein
MNTTTNISIGLTPEDWKQIGAYANSLIQNDMTAGKFQNNKSGLQYLSAQYKRYKANAMRRLTKGGKLKDFDPSHDYKGKRLYGKKKKVDLGKGKRISGLYAQSIESTNTAFVDMTLTGRLKKSLHVVKTFVNGVTCGYNPGDKAEGKIIGNRKYGREVLGLSTENQLKVRQKIVEILKRKVVETTLAQINIEVKF